MTKELRNGWGDARLGDLGQWGSGGTPSRSRSEYFERGTIPWLKIGDLNDAVVTSAEECITPAGLDACSAKLLPPDTLLVAMYGSIGKLGITGIPCATNQAIAFCHPDIDLLYLFWLLRLNRDALLAQGKGGTQANISQSLLKEFIVPVAPVAEQRRIVAAIEALVARVNGARDRLARVPAVLKRFRQSVLAAACSGRLSEEWREAQPRLEPSAALIERIRQRRQAAWPAGRAAGAREGRGDGREPILRDDLELQPLPERWTWVDLRFLVSESESFCYGVVQPGEDVADGVPLIRAGDLHELDAALPLLRRIPRDVDAQYDRSRVRGGEILVTVVGANIGTVALVPKAAAGFNIARAVAKVPIRDVSGEYVRLWLSSSLALQWMTGDAREVARPTLNLEQLQTLPVPLPPLAEQHEIVRRVTALFSLADAIERRVAAATARADKLAQSILARAFRGELVPQDPSDEPASVLLERIRAQRAAAPAPKRRARAADSTP